MGRICSVLAPALTILALAGCSSGHKKGTPTTSTTGSTVPATTTTGASTTTRPATTTTTGAPGTTTTTFVPATVFSDFHVRPASPISCNAPTSVELSWTSVGTTSVALSIDGKRFATFPGGHQDHLEYFACDGKKHTYALTAKVGTTTATVSADVTSKAAN